MSFLSITSSIKEEDRSPCHQASNDQVMSQDLAPEGAFLSLPPKVGVGETGEIFIVQNCLKPSQERNLSSRELSMQYS